VNHAVAEAAFSSRSSSRRTLFGRHGSNDPLYADELVVFVVGVPPADRFRREIEAG
jgi:hypothetical protein